MSDEPQSVEPFFVQPDGTRITLSQLPPRDHLLLSPTQKAVVVAAVRNGLITLGEACDRYHLSIDEYLAWHFVAPRGGDGDEGP